MGGGTHVAVLAGTFKLWKLISEPHHLQPAPARLLDYALFFFHLSAGELFHGSHKHLKLHCSATICSSCTNKPHWTDWWRSWKNGVWFCSRNFTHESATLKTFKKQPNLRSVLQTLPRIHFQEITPAFHILLINLTCNSHEFYVTFDHPQLHFTGKIEYCDEPNNDTRACKVDWNTHINGF